MHHVFQEPNPNKTRQTLVGHVKTIEKYLHFVLLNNGNNLLIDFRNIIRIKIQLPYKCIKSSIYTLLSYCCNNISSLRCLLNPTNKMSCCFEVSSSQIQEVLDLISAVLLGVISFKRAICYLVCIVNINLHGRCYYNALFKVMNMIASLDVFFLRLLVCNKANFKKAPPSVMDRLLITIFFKYLL